MGVPLGSRLPSNAAMRECTSLRPSRPSLRHALHYVPSRPSPRPPYTTELTFSGGQKSRGPQVGYGSARYSTGVRAEHGSEQTRGAGASLRGSSGASRRELAREQTHEQLRELAREQRREQLRELARVEGGHAPALKIQSARRHARGAGVSADTLKGGRLRDKLVVAPLSKLFKSARYPFGSSGSGIGTIGA